MYSLICHIPLQSSPCMSTFCFKMFGIVEISTESVYLTCKCCTDHKSPYITIYTPSRCSQTCQNISLDVCLCSLNWLCLPVS